MSKSFFTPELSLIHGQIYRGSGRLIEDGFVHVRAGRIVGTGSMQDAAHLPNPLDVQGAFVMPGVIESHGHLQSYGEVKMQLDLTAITDFNQVLAAIAARVRQTPASAWIVGWGWNETKWQQPFALTKQSLDAIAPDHPIALSRIDGHAMWVNSLALNLAGITTTTADPAGGRIVRDSRGQATGLLIDKAMDLVQSRIPLLQPRQAREALLAAASDCLALGITSFHDAWTSEAEVALYEDLAASGALPLRMYLMLDGRNQQLLNRYYRQGPRAGSMGDPLAIRAVKLFADGALGSRGAALINDYSDDPGNRGLQLMTTEQILQAAIEAGKAGFQVCTHAIGDRANQMVLDAYEQCFQQAPIASQQARFRVEHAQLVQPCDLGRFGRLHLIAAVQATHCTSDWPWALERLGQKRCQQTGYRWQSLHQHGAVVANGSDVPIEGANPLHGLYALLTRQSPQAGQPPLPTSTEECLNRVQALASMTENGAYAAFQESWLGRIEVGCAADISVWSENLLTAPPAQILGAKNLLTVNRGQVLYSRL